MDLTWKENIKVYKKNIVGPNDTLDYIKKGLILFQMHILLIEYFFNNSNYYCFCWEEFFKAEIYKIIFKIIYVTRAVK